MDDTLNKLDIDLDEQQEWLEALDDLVLERDLDDVSCLLGKLLDRFQYHGGQVAALSSYVPINTIPATADLSLPDDGIDGKRAHEYILWNAMAMVVRAGKVAPELGGHIATYASIATLYRVGFDYCFRQDQHDQLGDIVYFQGHSSPGIYARSFLEGRFDSQQLDLFRQEAGSKSGLSSYPHPYLMPDYWQFPTVSMGLGPLQAIYQARWQRYVARRLGATTKQRIVWAFCGDGEMDEPESKGCLQVAAREGLDNLIFVVNCNLQRLDGPVRSNASVIQELESFFVGAGWRVFKLLWNTAWDKVFALDVDGKLAAALGALVDGQYQSLVAKGYDALLAYLADQDPDVAKVVAAIPAALIAELAPGGHDPKKVYTVYQQAMIPNGKPTVILAHTIKGYGLGEGIALANTTHQHKKMSEQAMLSYAKKLNLPITEDEASKPAYYHPGSDDATIRYLKKQRQHLGGFMPTRLTSMQSLPVPEKALEGLYPSSGGKELSTTMAFVRILTTWLRDKAFAKYLVPIVPDESRTFGMEGLFRQIGIYSAHGQCYDPVDKQQIMYYKESKDGQLLQEGINEAGALASWLAAATSYSTNLQPMLPLYIFYSMFGFQRVGDLLWAAGDMRARGFLLGATAGRTTLAGEGLQHNDGHSQVMASLIPNCISYDPCYQYELAVILEQGAKRMVQQQEDVFFYVTLMNENYPHPQMPDGITAQIMQGMYALKQPKNPPKIHLLGSGAILREVEQAASWLDSQGVDCCVWSVTSFTELAREGLQKGAESHVSRCLGDGLPVVASTDYVRQYAEQIRAYIPGSYRVLGTDGFGLSDTRKSLRSYFAVDAVHVVREAVASLLENQTMTDHQAAQMLQALEGWGHDSEK
ncbi:MAG: pyruvate dehydrogenase (acetyl-transferring), homodimeric type [Pseudomonadota bacterium]|nr:pyruvate dehydrogenase (acetyl-transferring), homodimeric type [Pseudomonadota bacterium]